MTDKRPHDPDANPTQQQPPPLLSATFTSGVRAADPSDTAPPSSADAPCRPGQIFGDYELLSEIERGAMGIVYKARHLRLNRLVALKMILAGHLASAAEVERFRHEAEAVAALDHSGIVSIFEVGEHDGRHFFSMKLIEGGSLAQELASGRWSTGGHDRQREAARLVAAVARAVHYAHQRGILHRDLKPSNILLSQGTGAGELEPHVTDFGLAKRLDEVGLTQTGAIVGTPRYMAPEQARGGKGLTTAADVYSLGAILYELLTGKPPFTEEDLFQLLHQVTEREPEAPRKRDPRIHRDLETICLKCLDKAPSRRFGSAEQLADELDHWLRGEPIATRPVGRLERGVKWMRRNPAIASLLAVILLVTLAGVGGIVWALDKALTAAGEARVERDHALTNAQQAQRTSCLRALDLGQALMDQGDAGRGLLWICRAFTTAPAGAEGDDLRRVAWGLVVTGQGQLHTLQQRLELKEDVTCLAFSPDGKYFAVGRSLAVYETATARLVWQQPGYSLPVRGVVFSKDGRTLWTAAGSGDEKVAGGEIISWNATTGARIGEPLRSPSPLWCLALHPDEHLLLAGCADGKVRGWDPKSRAELAVHVQEKRGVAQVAFSRDGKRFLTCGGVADDYYTNRTSIKDPVHLWETAGFRSTGIELRPKGLVTRAVFAADGKTVLTGGGGGGVLWNAEDGKQIVELAPGTVPGIDGSADGRYFVTCGHDYKARVWDAQERKVVGQVLFHRGWLRLAAFSPDGQSFIIVGYNRLHLWNRSRPRLPSTTVLSLPARSSHMAFSGDGNRIVFRQDDKCVRLWDLDSQEALGPKIVAPALDFWAALTLAADRETILLPSTDGTIRRWNGRSGTTIGKPLEHGNPVVSVAVTRDGKTIVSGSRNGLLRFWDAATSRESLPSHSVFTGRITNSWIQTLAFSPDDRTLAVGTWHFWTYFWTPGAEKLQRMFHRGGAITCQAFSPDGRYLALASAGEDVVAIYDLQTKTRVGLPLEHGGYAATLAFSPDSRLLASGSGDGKARLWDVATGRRLGAPLPCRGAVRALVFRDQRTLLTADVTSTVLRWDVPELQAPDAERLQLWVELNTNLDLDEQGGVRVLDQDEWEQHKHACLNWAVHQLTEGTAESMRQSPFF